MRKPETPGEVDQKLAVKTLGLKAQAKRRAACGPPEQESAAETERAIRADASAPDDRISGSASGGRGGFDVSLP